MTVPVDRAVPNGEPEEDHPMTDDRKTLTLTAPDGWEFMPRPEGGWPDPWDGTEWRYIDSDDTAIERVAPDPWLPVMLVRTPPPTVTITEAQLQKAFTVRAFVDPVAQARWTFELLAELTGEGE